MNRIFVPYNVASSKNSKVWTGKRLIHSKTAMRYIKKTSIYYANLASDFRAMTKDYKPLRIGFYFVRDSKRKFDYNNVSQLPLDLMQKYKWIPDDCMDEVIPVFLGYEINKENPGVYISLLSCSLDKKIANKLIELEKELELNEQVYKEHVDFCKIEKLDEGTEAAIIFKDNKIRLLNQIEVLKDLLK